MVCLSARRRIWSSAALAVRFSVCLCLSANVGLCVVRAIVAACLRTRTMLAEHVPLACSHVATGTVSSAHVRLPSQNSTWWVTAGQFSLTQHFASWAAKTDEFLPDNAFLFSSHPWLSWGGGQTIAIVDLSAGRPPWCTIGERFVDYLSMPDGSPKLLVDVDCLTASHDDEYYDRGQLAMRQTNDEECVTPRPTHALQVAFVMAGDMRPHAWYVGSARNAHVITIAAAGPCSPQTCMQKRLTSGFEEPPLRALRWLASSGVSHNVSVVSFSYQTHLQTGGHVEENACLLTSLVTQGLLLVKPLLSGFPPKSDRPTHFVPTNMSVFMQSACAHRSTTQASFVPNSPWFRPVPAGARLIFVPATLATSTSVCNAIFASHALLVREALLGGHSFDGHLQCLHGGSIQSAVFQLMHATGDALNFVTSGNSSKPSQFRVLNISRALDAAHLRRCLTHRASESL